MAFDVECLCHHCCCRRLSRTILLAALFALILSGADALQRRGVVSGASSSTTTAAPARCILTRPVTTKRNFYYNGRNLPIRIETTDRASHQLISRVLRILLTEVVGHAKVELVKGDNGIEPSRSLDRFQRLKKDFGPEVMINLELWLPAGFSMEDWMNNGDSSVITGGPLGSLGRFGWFMSSSTVLSRWNTSRLIIDHWRSLSLPNVTSAFAGLNRDELRLLARPESSQRTTYCDEFVGEENGKEHDDSCHEGIYREPQCRQHHNHCAILLASSPELYGQKLVKQIQDLSLDVSVAWIGEHLDSYVLNAADQGSHPMLFFNWIPNILTANDHFSHVHFPECNSAVVSDYAEDRNLDQLGLNSCDFQIHQLTKVMWSKLRTHTPEAYHVVSNLQFQSNDLNQLLENYASIWKESAAGSSHEEAHVHSSEMMEQAACEWVRDNEALWATWLPDTLSSKQLIYLGGMFPLTGPYWRLPAVVPGAQMAVEYINSDPSILGDYELRMLVVDTQCKVDVAMKHFLEYVVDKTQPIAGILGPGCSETAEPIAGVSKHFNTIVISYSAEALQLTNRATYPLFFRTIPHILQNGEVYIEMFRRWKWEQVALLAEDGQNFPEYQAFLKDLFLSRSIQVAFDRKMPRQARMEDASKLLEELRRKEVKIIIMTSFEQAARAVMCEAKRKGMTAANGYVWFLPAWFTQNWWDTDHLTHYAADAVPCSSAEMFAAVQSHFFLNTAYLGPEESFIVGNSTVRSWVDTYSDRINALDIEFSPYASYAYDAVFVFALGLHKLLADDPSALESLHTDSTVQRFMYYLNNTHFSGASGPVAFAGADRTGIININQHIGNTSQTIGQFSPEVNRNLSERLVLDETMIRWLTSNGLRPSDGTLVPAKCKIETFRQMLGNVECETAIVVLNVIAISGILIIVTLFAVLTKIRYDRQMRLFKEQNGMFSDSVWPALDKWEIPKDRVVLNRKLGEGAFGTVYGGEALIEDMWVAVAVKTLKVGSNTEEKMDFLSEAEMMKRLEHKNIVRLLGVCTRGEPVYAVMEFMLHGDLKTFLLSRRQMVGQNTKEAEDVSALGLTQMALDVAYGLQYLSELKYVHRDLACRNCLVHADKTVKIGDFGMTRPMYDSDYYRFNKRGMFPVRWMAPESLVDGIFRTSSDIWSFGVLLYEIMTFGSFPYQGLSNRQVLAYVKTGQKIVLPLACPEKLHQLVQQCWSFDPSARPTVTDIIDILRNNLALIQPCLDAPCSAIAFEGTASLEMSLAPRPRAVRGSHPRRPSGDVLLGRRGLSTSSSHGGVCSLGEEDSKPSAGEYSPDAGLASLIDPFVLMASNGVAPSPQPAMELAPRYCRTTSGAPAIPLLHSHNNGGGRVSLDAFVRNTVFGRSMSTDPENRRASAVVVTLGRGGCGEITSGNKAPTALMLPCENTIGNSSVTCSTESLHAVIGVGLDQVVDCCRRAPTSSLESRTDSDYCSQHSKDYASNSSGNNRASGCSPFV